MGINFSYDINKGKIGEWGQVNTVEDLQQCVRNTTVELPFTVHVKNESNGKKVAINVVKDINTSGGIVTDVNLCDKTGNIPDWLNEFFNGAVMNFVSQVIFDYTAKKGNIKYSGEFSNVDNLIHTLHNSLYAKSFELVLTRTVQVVDMYSNGKPIVLGKENLNMIVVDKLTYPNDILSLLKQEYGDTFGFKEMNFAENKPVYFSGVLESEELGPKNPNTGDPTTYIRRYIKCRQLTESDIVVNKNLCDIKTGKMPNVLTDFLSRTTEVIR